MWLRVWGNPHNKNQFEFIRCLIITKAISMVNYEVDVCLFSKKIYDLKLSMVKDIAGEDSLYLYSQLPFVEILTFPAFFWKNQNHLWKENFKTE